MGDTPGACTESALKDELSGYCTAGIASGPPGMVKLPWPTPPGSRPLAASEIFMTRDDQINVDGAITNVNAFPDVWRRRGKSAWIIAAGGKVDTAQVARVMRSLAAAGHTRGHLAFTVPGGKGDAQPRDPAFLARLHAKIDNPDLGRKAAALAKEIQTSKMRGCGPLMKIFSAVSGADPGRRCELLAAGVAKAFPQCDCRDADEILTLFYAVMADTELPDRRGAWIAVTLDRDAEPTRVTPDTPWSSFISTLPKEALNALHLEVDDA